MTVDQFINALVTIMLIEMMVAVGLSVSIAELIGVARNWRLVLQAGRFLESVRQSREPAANAETDAQG